MIPLEWLNQQSGGLGEWTVFDVKNPIAGWSGRLIKIPTRRIGIDACLILAKHGQRYRIIGRLGQRKNPALGRERRSVLAVTGHRTQLGMIGNIHESMMRNVAGIDVIAEQKRVGIDSWQTHNWPYGHAISICVSRISGIEVIGGPIDGSCARGFLEPIIGHRIVGEDHVLVSSMSSGPAEKGQSCAERREE